MRNLGCQPAALCFALFACCHVVIAIFQCLYGGFGSEGSVIVILIAAALVWDNGLLALGSTLFPNASSSRSASDSSRSTFARLAAWSQPRFYAHAFLTPMLLEQTTRLGGRAGIEWLQLGSELNNTSYIAAIALAIMGTVHHAENPQLVLSRPDPREPRNSWMRSIVSATLADKSPTTLAWTIGPAILVCMWTIAVGACMGGAAGNWLWVSAIVELLSNAGPPWVMALSGNAGEVVLLAGFVAAERELMFE